eukprot:12935493-Heterocapsa_arctica.AAC.1
MPHLGTLWIRCKKWAAACIATAAQGQPGHWADTGISAARKVIKFEEDAGSLGLAARAAALAPALYE